MEIKIGEIYITTNTINNAITLDKIISIDGNTIITDYQGNKLYEKNYPNSIICMRILCPLYEYLDNPEKYPNIYFTQISKLWKKFMEHDTVEARKYKLKILNEYENK